MDARGFSTPIIRWHQYNIKFTGYISEGKYLDGNMAKIVTMAIKDTGIIIISMNSAPQKWYLNSEIFDLMLNSLVIKQ